MASRVVNPIPENYFERFEGLVYMLSSESLSCDGEISKKEIESRKASIKAQWEQLEVEVGFKVSLDSIEDEMLRHIGIFSFN